MDIDSVSKKLLKNRGLITDKQIQDFFSPIQPQDIKSPFDSSPAIELINLHIKAGNAIAIYGDYDVDGICSTAILWETLHKNYANVFPHIPHRESEGYGLSIKGMDACLEKGAKLIIAVDNGIVAIKEAEYCRAHNCDLIIIDHHEKTDKLPDANVILHSIETCAAGLSWFFCRDYLSPNIEHLALTAIAVICDMVPLLGINRSFAKYGLQELNQTTRVGLLALYKEASITAVTPYEVGFMIGPRINAMGRLEHAIDSLRLLCTNAPGRAEELAIILGSTNKARQDLTTASVNHALISVDTAYDILMVADPSYPAGIIGLIASKLTEKYHRPAIAISVGEKESKASARSVIGFHITDHIHSADHLLLGAGGHAMAAGFTVETAKILELTKFLQNVKIPSELLVKQSRVDAEISLDLVSLELWQEIQKFAPFGLGNPTPVFETKKVIVDNVKKMGKTFQHSKLQIGNLEAVAFNITEIPNNPIDLIYSLDKNTWNGNSKLQLLVKSIKSVHG